MQSTTLLTGIYGRAPLGPAHECQTTDTLGAEAADA